MYLTTYKNPNLQTQQNQISYLDILKGNVTIPEQVPEIEQEFYKITYKIESPKPFEELSEKLNISKEDIILALDATIGVESLDRNINDDVDGKTIGENVASKQDEYNTLMDKITVNSLLNVLNEKEKKIIIYRYYKEMTQCKIAEMCGTSQVQVSRIEKKALSKMKEALI